MFRSAIAAALLLTAASLSFAATFDPDTGTGNATAGEIAAAFGWSPAEYAIAPISFTECRSDYYAVTVQYKNLKGIIVSQAMVAEQRIYTTVRAKKTAAGYDFTGFGTPNKMNAVPAVGGGHIFFEAGQQMTGTITAAAFSNTAVTVNAFHGVKGWRKIFP